MEFSLTVLLICVVAYFAAGFVDSIAGGGGLITVPTLLLCGVPPHYTMGTGKLASGFGSLCAIYTYARSGEIIKKIAFSGFITSALGAAFGGWIALQIDSATMGQIMVVMLPIGLLLSLMTGGLSLKDGPLPQTLLFLRVALIGAGVGVYEGFFGPGSGSFWLIGIHVFLNAGLVKASGTAKVFNLGGNVGGVLAFGFAGSVLIWLALPCAAASILGNWLGARCAVRTGAALVRKVLYGVLSLLLASLVYRFFIAA